MAADHQFDLQNDYYEIVTLFYLSVETVDFLLAGASELVRRWPWPLVHSWSIRWRPTLSRLFAAAGIAAVL